MPSVHKGSVVGFIEPLRAFGNGSVLSLICQVAQRVLINNNCLPLFKLFLKLTFFSFRVFSINYFLANFPISSYFYIISLSWFNPVSYTHLDVYKRQVQLSPICTPLVITTLVPIQQCFPIIVSLQAFSYTHLILYSPLTSIPYILLINTICSLGVPV